MFTIRRFPIHRIVYCISENGEVVYIGEGAPDRLGTTLGAYRLDPATKKPITDSVTGEKVRKYSVLLTDTCGKTTGSAVLDYVEVDTALANALPVPNEMKPNKSHETLISTNVENILLALYAWHNGQLPRENEIQNDGENKGGWIADCVKTLQTYYTLYEGMSLPCKKPWPSCLAPLEQPRFKNGNPREKFLSIWWSKSDPQALIIGFCSVAGAKGTSVPHMTPDMNPHVKYRL